MATIVLYASCFLPADVAADTALAIALARARNTPASTPASTPIPETYAMARARAIREGKPLIVHVGGRQEQLADVPGIHVVVAGLEDSVVPSVMVGIPRDGELWREADLPGKPEREAIEAVLAPRAEPIVIQYRSFTRGAIRGGSC